MHKKFNRPLPATWGELLRIQEQQIETTATAMRLIDQSKRCSGMIEDLLRRRTPVDAEPIIQPQAA